MAAAPTGGYPLPEEAGFHHAALINELTSNDSEALRPYLVRHVDGNPQDEWLFDAFVLWRQVTESGKRTEYGDTDKADWESLLDQWFAPGGDLDTLEATIESLAQMVGGDGPPTKRQVILAIPWLSPAVYAFGDVDNNGVSENLATATGRDKVLHWFINEAARRFEASSYKHLALWGFYWMREDIVTDSETVLAASRHIHELDYKLLWIPYYVAPGWDVWYKYGIDLAIMQPSYAFRSWHDGGRVRRNRQAATARLAEKHGLGVEIEVRGIVESPSEQRLLLHYLHDGAKYGYQHGATAYFLGRNFIENTFASSDETLRNMYQYLADYIAGREVPDPDDLGKWDWSHDPDGTVHAERVWDEEQYVSLVDIFVTEDSHAPWQGKVSVAIKADRGDDWTAAGWMARAVNDRLADRWQAITVPVGQKAVAVKVSFKAQAGSSPLKVTDIVIDPTGPRWEHSASFQKPYSITPDRPRSQYEDNGRKLSDGRVATAGFQSDRNVGWQLDPGELSITFDLGDLKQVRRIEMYCQGGTEAGVNWPLNPLALFSTEEPVLTPEGFGSYPEGLSFVAGSDPVIDRQRSPRDMDGRIVFDQGHAVSAQYVTVFTESKGWTMCSEVSIWLDGEDEPLFDVPYTLSPVPSPGAYAQSAYDDDGRKLTNGIVATQFLPAQVTGWQDPAAREIVVDLYEDHVVEAMTIWALQDSGVGAYGPREVTFAYSDDRQTWHEASRAGRTACSTGGACALEYTVTLDKPVTARYVRARVYRSLGWTMISEFSVDAKKSTDD